MHSFEEVSLRTKRLLLRPLDEADAPQLFLLHSDAQVSRYLSRPPWESIDKAIELIALDKEAHRARKYIRLGIQRTEDALLIGECSLHSLNEASRRAEVGYAMRPLAWGNGYMAEALAQLLQFAFETLQLNRIEADIDPRNQASARNLERFGFKKEGYLRERWIVRGEVSDSALYGLLQADWRAQRGEPRSEA